MNCLQIIIEGNILFRASVKSRCRIFLLALLFSRRKVFKLSLPNFYIRSKAWAYCVKSKMVDIPSFDFMFFR